VVATTARQAAAQLDTIQRLRAALQEAGLPVAASQRQAESRRVVDDHLLMVVDFLGAMAWVMLAVGAMGLASTMGLSVLERTREIGVLRALGAGRASIAGMVQIEGLVIVLLAWVLSLPLSMGASLLLGEAFGRVMFALPTPWLPEPAAALRWLVLALGISLLACAVPARKASRVTVSQALNYG
jgi:putative ABC transport system permease protein